jgi:hypothetical protein
MLPPGRARLSTKPKATASCTTAMTIGIRGAGLLRGANRLGTPRDEDVRGDGDELGGEPNTYDRHAATVCSLSTVAIFRQPSILRNLTGPPATRLRRRRTGRWNELAAIRGPSAPLDHPPVAWRNPVNT